jgi:arylsulfatase A-like enzyme
MNPSSVLCALTATTAMISPAGAMSGSTPAKQPNVLFIAVDDLNNWVGFMGGHPQSITPNLDRLARRGTVFLNAHCQSPLCNPSRTSLLTGLRPTTTGVYALDPSIRTTPEGRSIVSLPQYFSQHGYTTYAVGKVWHQNEVYTQPVPPLYQNEFDVLAPKLNRDALLPKEKLVQTPCPWGGVDWGTFPHEDSDRHDYKAASWGIQQLQTMPQDKPFFLCAGFYLPHIPCIVPPKWFDLYPKEVQLPPMRVDDREDTPRASWYLHWKEPEPRLKWMEEHNEIRNFVRAYLASISFVDAQIGRLLDALEASPCADNTIIVLWSDNGYHLGEKGITGKNSLWDESTRVPLIFAGPRIPAGQTVNRPVELLDIYPTLTELAGLPPKTGLDGLSLTPQIRDPQTPRERPAITTAGGPDNHSVRTERYRYIRYADISEELYDMQKDPAAWTNLAGNPEMEPVKASLKKWIPADCAPAVPGSKNRYSEIRAGILYWDSTPVPANAPIPGIETAEQWK